MVAGYGADGGLLNEVAELYERLDRRLPGDAVSAGECGVCGRCCDFEAYDHRLYVTRPEVLYLAANLPAGAVGPMSGGRCPFKRGRRCGVYDYRFAGCRIFCCTGDADYQSRLSEEVLVELKSICTKFGIPYSYTELPVALKELTRP